MRGRPASPVLGTGPAPLRRVRGDGPVPVPLVEAGKATDVVVHVGPLSPGGRPAVAARAHRLGQGQVLSAESSQALAAAADLARACRLPLVLSLSSSGSDLVGGVAALDGWGRLAATLSHCSGLVPVVVVVDGPVLSGPALLLGLADAVVMTSHALVYVSGPAAVAELTGSAVRPAQLGSAHVHAGRSGLATLVARGTPQADRLVESFLSFLPAHCDELPPAYLSADPVTRGTPELRDLVPARATGSYDVRRVIASVADEGHFLELRPGWAPQLVTAFARVGGHPVGVLANQPQAMSGTLDIAASQKGARFVAMCDAFNVALLTMVDTSGFMPGRDLEWRGIIRHGAELVFAYAEATVPRVCLVLRKAYGGAYIVMDSKAMGNDLCIAWPSAELAVMGAEGAVSIIHRRADGEAKAKLVEEYRQEYLNPYVAAGRGYVDLVIDPADTRRTVARAFTALRTKREKLVRRKHGNSPL
ncbi:MAG TPA: carboxyl transferase domain-containing protein [Acidimicrobiales bacterium]|nr:carboxyl transferase domain-containing protein [Acidimicrobiales bacterium]